MGNQSFPGTTGNAASRRKRVKVSITCEVRQGTRPWKVVSLENLSATGFRISHFAEARSELPLRIRIPGLQLLSADIRWKKGAAVGCEFSEPLHIAVLEHIVRQAHSL